MSAKFGRAAGPFQDLNVFGPYLALPGIYLLYRVLTSNPTKIAIYVIATAHRHRKNLPVVLTHA